MHLHLIQHILIYTYTYIYVHTYQDSFVIDSLFLIKMNNVSVVVCKYRNF